MIETKTYGNRKTILIGQDSYYAALPCVVNGTEGEVVKAGQPLVGDIAKRDAGFTAGAEGAVGFLLHDIKINKDGKGNGTIVFAAVVDSLKLDNDVKAALKSAKLDKVIIVEGSAI